MSGSSDKAQKHRHFVTGKIHLHFQHCLIFWSRNLSGGIPPLRHLPEECYTKTFFSGMLHWDIFQRDATLRHLSVRCYTKTSFSEMLHCDTFQWNATPRHLLGGCYNETPFNEILHWDIFQKDATLRHFSASMTEYDLVWVSYNEWETKYGMNHGDRRLGGTRRVSNQRATNMHTLWYLLGGAERLWVCPECYETDS